MLGAGRGFSAWAIRVSLFSLVVYNGKRKHPDRSRGVVALAVEMVSRSRGAPQHCPLSSHQMRLTFGVESFADDIRSHLRDGFSCGFAQVEELNVGLVSESSREFTVSWLGAHAVNVLRSRSI